MNKIELIREFLGWCSIINIGLISFSTISIFFFQDLVSRIHSKMFNLEKADLSRLYFRFLAEYKILIIMFNIVPYLALKIIY